MTNWLNAPTEPERETGAYHNDLYHVSFYFHGFPLPLILAMSKTLSLYPYTLIYRTRWSDNDQYGHMNNSVYYFLIDSIVNTYLLERCAIESSGSIGLVVSSQCNFNAPISFPQVLKLGLRVLKIGRTSVTYEVGFFLEEDAPDAKPRAVGGYTHVFVHKDSRRPLTDGIVGDMRSGLEAILADEPGSRQLETSSGQAKL